MWLTKVCNSFTDTVKQYSNELLPDTIDGAEGFQSTNCGPLITCGTPFF